MLNLQSLVVYLKHAKNNENSYTTQVRQQYLRCNYTKFKLDVLIVFRHVISFPRVPIFCQFYYRIDREPGFIQAS